MSKSKWRLNPALLKIPQKARKPTIIQMAAALVLVGVCFTGLLAVSTAAAGNYGLQESAATTAANRFAQQLHGRQSASFPMTFTNRQNKKSPSEHATLSAPRGIDEGNQFISQSSGQSVGGAVYDPLQRIVKIVETTGGSVTSTRQFVWDGDQLCEERDGTGAVTKRFFSLGEQIAGTNYYYTRDHLGSVREMTNGAGAVQSEYAYSPWGDATKLAGTGPDADMQYAGMFRHARSGLYLAVNRSYHPVLGRFISRDPLQDPTFALRPQTPETLDPGAITLGLRPQPNTKSFADMPMLSAFQPQDLQMMKRTSTGLHYPRELNPYSYVANNPINWTDRTGLSVCHDDPDWDWCVEYCNRNTKSALAWLICMEHCMGGFR